MTDIYQLPDYNQVQTWIDDLYLPISASEAHGILVGLFAGAKEPQVVDWLKAMDEDLSLEEEWPENVTNGLQCLLDVSRTCLYDENLGFQLLLPDDEVNLSDRLNAVSEWCQGFLAGLGLAGCYINAQASQDVSEALRDITDISQLDPTIDDDAGLEAQEKMLVEIMEYVRMAVLLLLGTMQHMQHYWDDASNPQ